MIIHEKGTNRYDFINKKVSKYHWLEAGGSFLMSEPTAAVLLSQLEVAEDINRARVEVDCHYRAGIRTLGARGQRLQFGLIPPGCGICGHIFFVLCESEQQCGFIRRLMNEAKVQVFSHYVPLHSAPAGQRLGRTSGDMTVTDMAAKCMVRLPIAPQMTKADADRVISALSDALSAWDQKVASGALSPPTSLVHPETPVRSAAAPREPVQGSPSVPTTPKPEIIEQYLREVRSISREQLHSLLSCEPGSADGLLQEMRDNLLAGDAYIVPSALPREQLLKIRAYLARVGGSSIPCYHPIAPGAPDHHRLNVNDERAFVKGCFHQFSFFPWNQNVFDLFRLFRPVFEAKNLLSGVAKENFLGTSKDGQDGCCARLSFQFYPSSAGHLARHADPVGPHQLVVPLVLMSDKKGHAGAAPGDSYDFEEGGVYLERANGTRVCMDDLGGVGTVVFTNARVVHGVEAIDPIKSESGTGADWLAFRGRWMAGTFVNKLPSNTNIGNAIDLSKK